MLNRMDLFIFCLEKGVQPVTSILRRLRMVAVLATMLLIPSAGVMAQNAAKPAVVVALKGLNELFDDLTAVGQWAGAADQVGFPLMIARGTTSKVDQNKPIGAALTFVNGDLRPLIFMPVSDLQGLFAQLRDQIGSPKELEKGLYEMQAGGQQMFVREGEGWAFMSNDRASLAKTPANPADMVSGLTKNYDIAIQINIQNIPNDLRQVAMTQIKAALEAAAQNAGDPNLQEQMQANLQRQMTSLVEETDSITIGLSIDAKEQNISAEFGMTAKDGTELAKTMALNNNLKSLFGGLVGKNSAASLSYVGKMASQDVDQLMGNMKQLREQAMAMIDNAGELPDQATRDDVKSAMGSIMDSLEATLKGGSLDLSTAIVLDDDEFKMVAGGLLADGTKFENGVKKIVDTAKTKFGFDGARLNIGSFQGVNFHTVSVPLNGADDSVQEIFGDTLEVTLGIGKDRMYVSIGEDGINTIKKAMENSSSAKTETSIPMTMSLALAPIMKFAANTSEDPNLQRIAEAMAQTAGKDHVRITNRSVPRGSIFRLEIEQGVIKAIGGAAASMGAGRGGF